MRKDIWKFGVILFVALLFGLSIGQPLATVLVASIGIIAWQIYQLQIMYLWLTDNKKNPSPDTSGQVHLIHRIINKRQLKERNRKRQLKKYLKQFRHAASALPDSIILIDQHGKIDWANKNAEALLGIVWPADKGVRFTDLIRQPEVESLIHDNNQNEIEITSRINPDNTINVQIVQYTNNLRMVIARDISRLVKVSQIQSDFVANVSHELKTPLTVLKGYIEILQSSPALPGTLIKPLDHMNTQSERMEFIVQDLLYLAKLESKDNQPQHTPVDITNIINTILETVDDRVRKKQLKIELDIDYSLKAVGSDTELHAAFSNLIFNAVNYTPAHGIINIRWQSNQNGATFVVRDNGEGFPSSYIPRLTQRFFRIDSNRSREGGGTGLGLAIVKHVIQRHNAQLEIDSVVGIGSEFKCVFPSSQIYQSDQKQNSI